jgi:hypothetical protein
MSRWQLQYLLGMQQQQQLNHGRSEVLYKANAIDQASSLMAHHC